MIYFVNICWSSWFLCIFQIMEACCQPLTQPVLCRPTHWNMFGLIPGLGEWGLLDPLASCQDGLLMLQPLAAEWVTAGQTLSDWCDRRLAGCSNVTNTHIHTSTKLQEEKGIVRSGCVFIKWGRRGETGCHILVSWHWSLIDKVTEPNAFHGSIPELCFPVQTMTDAAVMVWKSQQREIWRGSVVCRFFHHEGSVLWSSETPQRCPARDAFIGD